MGSEGVEPNKQALEPEPEPELEPEPVAETESKPTAPPPVPRKRKLFPYIVLGAGGLVAAALAAKAPREQHVKLVLGPHATDVTGLEVQYVADDGDVARDARMTFEPGLAPRVVGHDPQLVDGDYSLQIDLETREGRRSLKRRVTLGGGTTQVDLTAVLTAPPPNLGPHP